jgi:hypothetical protein
MYEVAGITAHNSNPLEIHGEELENLGQKASETLHQWETCPPHIS